MQTCKEVGVNAIVEYFGEETLLKILLFPVQVVLVDGVIVFYEGKDDSRIQYLKKNNMPFIVFGESHTDGVIYVSNNDF